MVFSGKRMAVGGRTSVAAAAAVEVSCDCETSEPLVKPAKPCAKPTTACHVDDCAGKEVAITPCRVRPGMRAADGGPRIGSGSS